VGTEGRGIAHDRECLSTDRYDSRHTENGRAMPYLQTKLPHVPKRADSATFSRASSREERSERQICLLRPFGEADTAHEWGNSTEADFDSSFAEQAAGGCGGGGGAGWETTESISRPPGMAVAIAKTVVPCHTCKLIIRTSQNVQTVQHSRGYRHAKSGPKDKPTYCDRSQRPAPPTSGTAAQRQISIRLSKIR